MAITNATGEGPPNGLPGDPGSTYNRSDGPPFLYRRFASGWVEADVIDESGQVATANIPDHAANHSTGNDVIASAVADGDAGLMTGADKAKLNGIATGATANSPDATLLNRANHTGSQAQSTVTNLTTDLAAKESSANKGAASGYAGLDAGTKIPIAQVPTGSTGSTVCIGNDSRLSDARTPTSHATSHQNNGGDEISVTGLSGLLADAQTPLAHTHSLADITNEGALASKNTIATADIDNDAVTYAKIQNVTDARLLGRSAGSSGDAQEITVGSGLSLSAGALTATGGGGGGVSQLIVNLISDGANVAWTNMPSAVTFFAGSHRFATKVDLTDYTECRLIVNKQATAGAAASIVRLRYIAAFNTTVSNWLQIGASSVQVAVNVQNTVLDSGWIALAAGAQADVFITLDGSGGDGVLDPGFGVISAQFR